MKLWFENDALHLSSRKFSGMSPTQEENKISSCIFLVCSSKADQKEQRLQKESKRCPIC